MANYCSTVVTFYGEGYEEFARDLTLYYDGAIETQNRRALLSRRILEEAKQACKLEGVSYTDYNIYNSPIYRQIEDKYRKNYVWVERKLNKFCNKHRVSSDSKKAKNYKKSLNKSIYYNDIDLHTFLSKQLRKKGLAVPNSLEYSSIYGVYDLGNAVEVELESKWTPKEDLFKSIKELYGCDYVYVAEEPGCEVFVNTDTEGLYYKDKFVMKNNSEEVVDMEDSIYGFNIDEILSRCTDDIKDIYNYCLEDGKEDILLSYTDDFTDDMECNLELLRRIMREDRAKELKDGISINAINYYNSVFELALDKLNIYLYEYSYSM